MCLCLSEERKKVLTQAKTERTKFALSSYFTNSTKYNTTQYKVPKENIEPFIKCLICKIEMKILTLFKCILIEWEVNFTRIINWKSQLLQK